MPKELGELVKEMTLMLIKNPDIINPENEKLTSTCKDYQRYLEIKKELNKWKKPSNNY